MVECVDSQKNHEIVTKLLSKNQVSLIDDFHENEEEGWRRKLGRYLHIKSPLVRQALSEFIGTAVLLLLSVGVVAQSVLSKQAMGEFLSINIASALAVTLAIIVSGGPSGGHINPAISIMFYALGDINYVQLLVYIVCQMAGGIFGSAVAFFTYFEAINAFDGGVRQVTGPNGTAGMFFPFPKDTLSAQGGFIDQIVGTGILSSLILAIVDPQNMAIPRYLMPICVGLVVATIGMTFGYNCGYPLNPARDLGPRIFTAMAGWGIEVFSYRNYNWFWVPVVGPIVGALVGAAVYMLTIGNHWPQKYKNNLRA